MSVSELAIRRPVATAMAAVAVLLLGWVSMRSLSVDRFPDVSFPIVNVTARYPGASPTDVERAVTRPIEDAISGINGIDRVRSFSRDSFSQTLVVFQFGIDPVEATTAVRERLSRARARLPKEVDEPVVARFDAAQAPVLTYALRGAGSATSLRRLAEDRIKPVLEQVDGVGSVEVLGGARREVAVELDRARADALGLSPQALAGLLDRSSAAAPAGRLSEGAKELSVRTNGEFTDVAAIRDLRVATAADGSAVRLAEVASVRETTEEPRSTIFVNGAPAVTLEVRKRSEANTLALADAVKKRALQLQAGFSGGEQLDLLIDQSSIVRTDVDSVWFELWFGGVLAVLVILFFMQDLRSTLIGAIALLTSVVGSFLALAALGYSLNMMTLLGLSLAIGLLIDDAVVVRENITRHLERGASAREAAIHGTKEIAPSVAATTLTVVAVFAPVAFLKGMVGQFFREFGITVSVAVLISLVVAFTVDPMLSAHFVRRREGAEPLLVLKTPVRRFLSGLSHAYVAILEVSLRRRGWVALGVAALIALTIVAKSFLGSEFMTPEDRGQFLVDLEFAPGTSLAATARGARGIETSLLGLGQVRMVYSTIGIDGEVNRARLRVLTPPKSERRAALSELKEAAKRFAERTGAQVRVSDPPFIEGFGAEAPIMIHVRGRTHEEILPIATQIAQILRDAGGVDAIELKSSSERDELEIAVDRDRALDANLGVTSAALQLRGAITGAAAGNLRRDDEDVPIRVRYQPSDRGDDVAVASMTLSSGDGPIKVADVARLRRDRALDVIERENRGRQIPVWGVPRGRPLGDIAREIFPKIAALQLPSGASIAYVGQLKLMTENESNMGVAVLLGLACIYLLLAAQFENLVHPLTIMITLPLGLLGAVLGLFLAGKTLAMGAMIGILLLMGLVTKNAILLLDRVLHLVRAGLPAYEAVMQAAPERLRPILMTSATMVFGMLPTALASGEGSEFRAPMAIAVLGGIVSSTALSLIVVPVVYLAIESLKATLARRFGRAASGPTNYVLRDV